MIKRPFNLLDAHPHVTSFHGKLVPIHMHGSPNRVNRLRLLLVAHSRNMSSGRH